MPRHNWPSPLPRRVVDGMSRPRGTPSGPNCGITAIAVAAGVSFAAAKRAFLNRFPKRGNWKGGTRESERMEVLADLGVKVRRVELPRRMALRTWVLSCCPNTKARYIVRTTGHVQIVKGNRVTDQHNEACSIIWFNGGGRHVRSVYRIMED